MDRERRNQIILIVVATLAAVGLVYSLVVTRLQYAIAQEKARLALNQAELNRLGKDSRDARTTAELARHDQEQLLAWEAALPGGALYASMLARLEPLAASCEIEELALGPVVAEAEAIPVELSGLRPGYRGMKGSVNGVGSYFQLGLFVAGFENAFPFLHLSKLEIDIAGPGFMADTDDDHALGMVMSYEGCAQTNAVFQ